MKRKLERGEDEEEMDIKQVMVLVEDWVQEVKEKMDDNMEKFVSARWDDGGYDDVDDDGGDYEA